MQAPNKKSLIAAAAAPFALTLALGAVPAYANGNGNGNQSGQANAQATANADENSTATFEVVGECILESSKDISYVEFTLADGSTKKIELQGGTTFDLKSVDFEFVSVTAKAGTSVSESFTECATTSEGGDDSTDSNGEGDGDTGNGDTGNGDSGNGDNNAGGGNDGAGVDEQDESEVENESGQDKADENKNEQDDKNENAVGGRDNNDRSGNSNDAVAGAEASAGADVRGNVSAEVRGNATTGTPETGGDAVLGTESETDAYQPMAADGSTQYLPNTGAEENAALIAGGAGLAGLGAWMMVKRRRFGLER